MGLMDKIKGMFGQQHDTIEGGIDKAGDFVDDKTGGKYADNVDKAQDTAHDALDKLAGEDHEGETK
jgi:MT0933-like antitoxin protein